MSLVLRLDSLCPVSRPCSRVPTSYSPNSVSAAAAARFVRNGVSRFKYSCRAQTTGSEVASFWAKIWKLEEERELERVAKAEALEGKSASCLS